MGMKNALGAAAPGLQAMQEPEAKVFDGAVAHGDWRLAPHTLALAYTHKANRRHSLLFEDPINLCSVK